MSRNQFESNGKPDHQFGRLIEFEFFIVGVENGSNCFKVHEHYISHFTGEHKLFKYTYDGIQRRKAKISRRQ